MELAAVGLVTKGATTYSFHTITQHTIVPSFDINIPIGQYCLILEPVKLIHFDLPIFPWRFAEEKKREIHEQNLRELEEVNEMVEVEEKEAEEDADQEVEEVEEEVDQEVEEVERSAERLEVAIRTLVSRDLLPTQVHLVFTMIILPNFQFLKFHERIEEIRIGFIFC